MGKENNVSLDWIEVGSSGCKIEGRHYSADRFCAKITEMLQGLDQRIADLVAENTILKEQRNVALSAGATCGLAISHGWRCPALGAVDTLSRNTPGDNERTETMGFSLWGKIKNKFKQFGRFMSRTGEALTIAIEAGDVKKIGAHLDEFDEMLQQGSIMSAKLRQAVADGELTPGESAMALNQLERFLDEAKDVITGEDEDNPK